MVIMGPGRTIIDQSISSLQMISADIFSIEESLKSKPKKTEKKGTTSASKKAAYSPVSGSDDFY